MKSYLIVSRHTCITKPIYPSDSVSSTGALSLPIEKTSFGGYLILTYTCTYPRSYGGVIHYTVGRFLWLGKLVAV